MPASSSRPPRSPYLRLADEIDGQSFEAAVKKVEDVVRYSGQIPESTRTLFRAIMASTAFQTVPPAIQKRVTALISRFPHPE